MIVVTGGAGFIGSCLVWKLNRLGHQDILIVDEKGTESPKSSNWNRTAVADYYEKDEFLTLVQKGKVPGKIDVIFHMGACAATTEQNRDYLYENNYLYSKKLAEWAVRDNIQFLYASSAATYGDGEIGYSDDDAVSPKLKPLNPYGDSKQMFDVWVLENKLSSILTGFKFFNVYGPNEYHKDDMRSMIHKGYQQIKKEGKLKLFRSHKSEFADGEQKRDFIYIKDVLEVMIWFWENPASRGIFNLGTGKAETWNHLGQCIFEALGRVPKIEYIDMPANIRDQYQYWTQADLSKLRRTGMNFSFSSLKEGIADYVRHLEQGAPYLVTNDLGKTPQEIKN